MELIDRGETPALDVVRADATRAFRTMKSGGVSVLPLDVSYAIFAATARGVERIFELKNRKPTKPNGIVGNWDIFSDVLKTQPRDKDLVRCLTQDHDLPLSVIAPYTIEHDWLRTVEFGAIRRATKEGTMDLLLNAGALHNELARMSWEAATPLMGSSANVSLAGSKFRLADVEESVKQGSDSSSATAPASTSTTTASAARSSSCRPGRSCAGAACSRSRPRSSRSSSRSS